VQLVHVQQVQQVLVQVQVQVRLVQLLGTRGPAQNDPDVCSVVDN
jgi:hypothetical protein